MRYVFFPFILIFLLITLSFCTGCSYNDETVNQALHDNSMRLEAQADSSNINATEQQCTLIDEKNTLLKEISNIKFD